MVASPSPAPSSPSPEGIFQLTWGFAATQALVTALELDVFSRVAAGARTPAALAKAAAADVRGVRMLTDALVGLGLLRRAADGLELTPDAATFLVRSSPACFAEFLLLHGREIADRWRSLTECVRTGRPATAVDRPAEGVPFWARLVDGLFPVGYAAAQALGRELARRHPTGPVELLDVAAGSGVWGFGAASVEPRVVPTAMDLPETLVHARAWAVRTGLGSRARWLEGDLRTADLGTAKFDAAVLGHICHSEGPVHTPALLRKVARALRPGGTLAIVEFVPDDDRSGPAGPLLFALNMLVHTTEGDTFTRAQYAAWLDAAGFRDVVAMPAPAPSPLLLATRR